MEGYIYLLQHHDLAGIKIGRTTRSPKRRLAEHNVRGWTGDVARESGKPWKLLHYVPVTDASLAEAFVWEYFAVPKFGKFELHGAPLDWLMQVLTTFELLDKDKYAAMLEGELKAYDVSKLLEEIRIANEKRAAEYAAENKRQRAYRKAAKNQIAAGLAQPIPPPPPFEPKLDVKISKDENGKPIIELLDERFQESYAEQFRREILEGVRANKTGQ